MTFSTLSPRHGVNLAYHRTPAQDGSLPGVIFLGGFRSDMTGTKAVYLEEQCRARGQGFLRFDYSGHGASNGKFEDCTIGSWLMDTLDVFDKLTEGTQIVVGSSMGGWLALLLAIERPDRVAGLVGLAVAPDFSEDIYRYAFSEEHRRHLQTKGLVYWPSDYSEPYPLTKNLFDDAKQYLLLKGRIPISCPVRLIHGKRDNDVPWQKSQAVLEKLESRDKDALYVADGDHRLSRPQDLQLIDTQVQELSRKIRLKRTAQA